MEIADISVGTHIGISRCVAADQVLMTCSHVDKFHMSHLSHNLNFPKKMDALVLVCNGLLFLTKLTFLNIAMLQLLVTSTAEIFENQYWNGLNIFLVKETI